uniref:Alpha-aminoadipic semialdehyde synthase, mitochondrial-like n=1 Tax=Diabrotica virgifera virgifera TaxID=50390 RepID=A0A6P7FJT2_DIAVI
MFIDAILQFSIGSTYLKIINVKCIYIYIFVGTLRYSGFAQAARQLQFLGLLDTADHPSLHQQGPEVTWRKLICDLLGLEDANMFYDNLKNKISERTGTDSAVDILEELGLLDNQNVVKCGTPIDTLTHYLSTRLALEKNERDLVILRHDVGIVWPDHKIENRGINLVVYGDSNGHSAMAKTVGYPTAIATKMILDGEIQERGCLLPFAQEIYRPMLQRLRAEGLTATETSKFA